MHPRPRRLVRAALLVAALSACLVTPADAARRVELAMLASVTRVEPVDLLGRRVVVIDRGASHGVVVGAVGSLYSRSATGGLGDVIARTRVLKTDDTTARVEVTLGPAASPDAVVEGTQVEQNALLPASVHRGVLLRAWLYGIDLRDNYREPLVTWPELLADTDGAVEARVLAKMVTCGHEVIEFTVDMTDRVNRGKWQGKLLSEVLKISEPADYEAFLRFVMDFPGKYIGKTWKISEVYATWVINHAPPAHVDRLAELRAATPAELKALAAALKDDELEGVVEYTRGELQSDAMPVADAEAALALLDRVVALRGGKPSPSTAAELLHLRVRVLDRRPGTARKTEKLWRELAEAYIGVGDYIEAFVAANNAVGDVFEDERYADLPAAVAATRALVARERVHITDPQLLAHVPKTLAFLTRLEALVAQRQGRYQDVVDALTPLVGSYLAVGYPSARSDEMGLLETLASAHTKLGQYAAARELYDQLGAHAEILGDDVKRLDLLWEIGDLHWTRSQWPEAIAVYDRMAALAEKAGQTALGAKAQAAAAQALWQTGAHAEALARHERALALRETLGDKSGLAWQLVQMGKILIDAGERERARGQLDRALALRRELGQRSEEAAVLLELGDLDLALTLPRDAAERYAAARAIYKALTLAPDEARALQGMASAALKLGAFAEAAGYIEATVAIHKRAGDKAALSAALIWSGRVLEALGKPADAERAYVRARDVVDRDAVARADALVAIGHFAASHGRLDEAHALGVEARQIALTAKDVWRELQAERLLGQVASNRADFAQALAHSDRRLALARESGSRPEIASALGDRAWLLVDIGRLADARAAIDEAIPLAAKNGDPVEKAWFLNTLSRVEQAYGNTDEELRLLDEGVEIARGTRYPYLLAALIFNRSIIFARVRDLDRALADNLEAEKIGGSSLDTAFRVPMLNGRGQILVLMKRYAEAETALRAALAEARTGLPLRVPSILRELARVQDERGKVDAAVATLREAVALEEGMAGRQYASLARLGVVLAAAGRDAEADKPLTDAIARARERGGEVPWEALYQLGAVRARAGDRGAAVTLLTDAVHEIERGDAVLDTDAARDRYHADKTVVYRLLVKLLLAEGKVEDALIHLERSKVAELSDVGRRAGTGGDPAAALAMELDVQEARLQRLLDQELRAPAPDDARVRRLDGLLASVRQRRAGFVERLDRDDALFDRYAVRPLQLEKLQQYLQPGTLILAPVILDDRVVVFAVTRTVLTHFSHAATAAEIGALVTGFAKDTDPRTADGAVGAASLARVKRRGKALYDALVGPAFEAVGVPDTLIVSASGALRYVPFAGLWDGSRWLVERTAVVNVTALDREKFAASPNAKATTPGGAKVLALVDPDGTLPGARVEVNGIQRAIAGVDVFEGPDATLSTLRTRVRVPGYDIVHFATHGRLDTANPEQSHILLSGKALAYADIPTLAPAHTRLVVLSACQTAVHAGGTGVEIAGLAYQFQRSNIGSVLATLWEVDDQASAELMSRFYAKVEAGASYVGALADAQRELATDAALGLGHPAYWAPFFLMGRP